MLCTVSHWLLAAFFLAAGIYHFINPDLYLQMMPSWLPWPAGLVALSGAAEILGGIALLMPATRRVAGWWLIALLVAVFPANIHVALHGFPALKAPPWVLWARLPFQAVLIAWIYWAAIISVKAHKIR
jgi:uncharacterized membrane protein